MAEKQFNFLFHENNRGDQFPGKSLCNSKMIAIYTVLCILRRMRDQLGLEAMLEYLDHYLRIIDTNNPRLRNAVNKGIGMINIERIYKDSVRK